MKKIILAVIMLTLLITGCTNNNGDNNNLNTDNEIDSTIKENEVIEIPNAEEEIDRSEYLTGEIITDGYYSFPLNHARGIIYFVPDEESSEIIKEKYNYSAESFLLFYNDIAKVENLPQELGIYKIKVKAQWNNKGKSFVINDIQLTDKIGTVLYEGKVYETNELDENVKVKDKVCGLIVKWISRDKETDGIQIRFAGEIENEGYYSIYHSEMYNDNIGIIYFNEAKQSNIPFIASEKRTNFSFFKTNELFDKLQNFSSFGKGKFKTTNYQLVYNIGMGRSPSDYLTEIVSLDEAYKDMFIFDRYKHIEIVAENKELFIVSLASYDERFNPLSTDFYYIYKNEPEKILLYSSGVGYRYEPKPSANENEFILSSDGYNYMTGNNDKGHIITFKISDNGVVTKKIED